MWSPLIDRALAHSSAAVSGELLVGLALLFGYFIVFIAAASLLRHLVTVPREVFRKTLHVIVVFAIFVLIYGFDTWWVSVIAALVFIVVVYPGLAVMERFPRFSHFLTERHKGELKRSLVAVFAMFAIVTAVCWGIFNAKYIAVASVLAWGFGDAAAALVGQSFGRYPIRGALVEGTKSWEGTIAMAVVAFLPVVIILWVELSAFWLVSLAIAVVTAVVSALVELFTKRGLDTFTCPLAAAAVLLPLTQLAGA